MNVVLTHSNGRFESLKTTLEQRGFLVVHHPLIRTQTIPNVDLEPILDCAWWLFTSVAAVEAVVNRDVIQKRKVAAVGAGTAQALRSAGANVEFVSTGGNAASFAKEFLGCKPQEPIALLGGDHSLLTLQQALSNANLEFRFVAVYQTLLNSWDDFELAIDQHHAIVLMSPTAVNNMSNEVALKADLVALGQTTAASIEARGWSCVVAQKPEMAAVIEVLEALKDRRSDARFN
jgi:uroporphyrinogen-III synthase